jgi:hypothetical protein
MNQTTLRTAIIARTNSTSSAACSNRVRRPAQRPASHAASSASA